MKLTPLETEMLTALQEVLEAYRSYGSIAMRHTEEYTSLTAVRRAIRHAKAKKNQTAPLAVDRGTGRVKSWSWQCNECGSDEFSASVSEDDLESLSCTGCGGHEFHKVERT